MKNEKTILTVLWMFTVFMAVGIFLPGLVSAGDLEPPAEAVDGSGNPVPTMKTLDEIYDKLDEIDSKIDPGPCEPVPCDPCDPCVPVPCDPVPCDPVACDPVPCDPVPCEPIEAGVPKTGQTTSYAQGDDGDLQMGVPWPVPRFTDNGDGTVTDNLTGLIWLQNANCFGQRTWFEALSDSNNLADGQCGLTDGSVAGDWHLPSIKELQSLIDFSTFNPALPSGHPFSVLSEYYWSSTTRFYGMTTGAWFVSLDSGYVADHHKSLTSWYVWPVR